jgi:hypothetical protein
LKEWGSARRGAVTNINESLSGEKLIAWSVVPDSDDTLIISSEIDVEQVIKMRAHVRAYGCMRDAEGL